MLNIITSTIGEEVKKEYGDKILPIPSSLVRRICGVGGTAVGGAGGGAVALGINLIAGAVGAPGALFAVIGGSAIGIISGSLTKDICQAAFEEAAVQKTSGLGRKIVVYVKPGEFCKKFLNMSDDQRTVLMRVGGFIRKCGRFRLIE
jgi:hypothetical protein